MDSTSSHASVDTAKILTNSATVSMDSTKHGRAKGRTLKNSEQNVAVASKEKRKGLQILQPSAGKEGGLVSGSGKILHLSPKKGSKPAAAKSRKSLHSATEVKIVPSQRMNVSRAESVCHIFTQTDDNQESATSDQTDALSLMTGEVVPAEYWKVLADRRQEALHQALAENEVLSEKLAEMSDKLERAEAEIELLKPLAEQAQHLAAILKDLSGIDGDEASD